MSDSQKANHLLHEASPYLQQHAYNPVNWYPWGEAAIAKARQEDKPILLSIGYAACHWCHVMADESFEDEKTAELMNRLFVNIKVDKEERPDLDKIYQTSHYLLSHQSGGWPLTVFLTADLIPFFSGTYFPPQEHQQLPAFSRVLQTIADLYQTRRGEIEEQSLELKRILAQPAAFSAPLVLSEQPLQDALILLQKNYDKAHGGFGTAPKFPQASRLEYLLHNKSPLALLTLKHMAQGGIYDQLGGGFYRYSVDERWNIPHFEKMLYDNGQLLGLYSQAAELFNEPSFDEIIYDTAQWILDEMEADSGGYYSSLDADSEGEEGKFYRWSRSELQTLLTTEEYSLLGLYYGLSEDANFEEHWHFYLNRDLLSVAKTLKLTETQARQLLLSARTKLKLARSKRIPPFRDEKILTAWNGLMMKGLFLAGEYLQEERFIVSAQKALDFIRQNLWIDGYLRASYKDGKAYLRAYLDDYVFLLDAVLTALQVNWNTSCLLFAIELADFILEQFQDEEGGGFFFTAREHEQLVYRPKTMMDDAIPAGNGVLVRAFLLLGQLIGNTSYLDAAEKTLLAAWPALSKYPAEHCSLLSGLQDYLDPPQLIILRGNEEKTMQDWRAELKAFNTYIFAIPNQASCLPQGLALKKEQGNCCAYFCRGRQCETVITRP